MKLKRNFIIVTAVVLFALTGAKVGALWPQKQERAQSLQPIVAPLDVAEPLQHSVDPQTRDILGRLNGRLQRNPDDFEASLLKGLLLFQGGNLAAAIDELQLLTHRAPKFQLAHLVLGDLLLARFSQVDAVGASGLLGDIGSAQERHVAQLQSEAQARLRGYLSLLDGVEIPRALLTLSDAIKYALVVDKGKNRLYVYHNSGPGLPPELVDDFYVVLGKRRGDKRREGDLRTPSGVYFITSYLPDKQLPPLYGRGAFPVNYPNEYDLRLQKTGTGIWLHGTDKALYSRPPLDSEGCVVLTNEEFSRIRRYVEVGQTPVVISEAVQWISSRAWLEENIEIQAALETWRQTWEKADLQAYLHLYSDAFWAKKYDKKSWGHHKKRVFAAKKHQQINLSNVSILAYPQVGSKQMVVANFDQHYRSNNFNGDLRKRLYMVKEADGWKILYEGRQ